MKMPDSLNTKSSQLSPTSTIYQVKIDWLPKRAKIEEIEKLFAYISNSLEISFLETRARSTKSALVGTKIQEEYFELLKSSRKIHGRHLCCEPYNSIDPNPKRIFSEENSKRVFIKGIPFKLPDSGLKDIFSRFGELEYAYSIKKNKLGTGYGFAKFLDKSSAERVIRAKTVNGPNFVLDCCPFKKGNQNASEIPGRRDRAHAHNRPPPPQRFQPPRRRVVEDHRDYLEESPLKAGLVTYGVLLWHHTDNLRFNESTYKQK